MIQKLLQAFKIPAALSESERMSFLISSALKQVLSNQKPSDQKAQTNKIAKRFQVEIFNLQQKHHFGWVGKAFFAHGIRMSMQEQGFTEETAEEVAKELAVMISLVKTRG